ncbi:hypothetical protein ACLOJK_040305 [Asimina triloba]
MFAIVCGKRSFFEDIDSPPQSVPLKRLRRSPPASSLRPFPDQRIHGGDATAENVFASNLPANGSEWVELLMREMTNASNMDDARARASRVLEVLQKSILDRAGTEAAERLKESMIQKQQLEALIGDNTLLKRAVVIQHKRQKEFDERKQELQHLKQLVVQCGEQVNALKKRRRHLADPSSSYSDFVTHIVSKSGLEAKSDPPLHTPRMGLTSNKEKFSVPAVIDKEGIPRGKALALDEMRQDHVSTWTL